MKIEIPSLSREQAEAVVKAIHYHLGNEGVKVISDVPYARLYSERSLPLLPEQVEIIIRAS